MNLSRFDLNLFVVFDTIYSEGNLTRAGDILCITQPAVSNALSRLRDMFGDPLFVRSGHKMVPTPMAKNCIAPVRDALKMMRHSLQLSEIFDPSSSRHQFRISMSDIVQALYLPAIVRSIHSLAPNIVLQSLMTPRSEIVREMSAGLLDFAIDVEGHTDLNLHSQKLFRDRYVCVMRKGHPMEAETLTLDRYLGLSHIHISSRRKGGGHIDMALSRLGLERRIALRIPHWLAAPSLVEGSDLVVALPYSLAKNYPHLTITELPFDVALLEGTLYWHKSADQDEASRWIRQQICSTINNERSASETSQPFIV